MPHRACNFHGLATKYASTLEWLFSLKEMEGIHKNVIVSLYMKVVSVQKLIKFREQNLE